MRRKRLPKCYHTMSDAELMAMFDNIGNRPENRVKRTGHIKLAAAKFGDQILDFVKARRTAAVRGTATTDPTTIYVGRRENCIAEVGGLSHIYEGKYLICPDGPANYDCEGAANITEARAIVETYRENYPTIEVCYI